jgi:hypothetical protein
MGIFRNSFTFQHSRKSTPPHPVKAHLSENPLFFNVP